VAFKILTWEDATPPRVPCSLGGRTHHNVSVNVILAAPLPVPFYPGRFQPNSSTRQKVVPKRGLVAKIEGGDKGGTIPAACNFCADLETAKNCVN
jgi:hypothetical protein